MWLVFMLLNFCEKMVWKSILGRDGWSILFKFYYKIGEKNNFGKRWTNYGIIPWGIVDNYWVTSFVGGAMEACIAIVEYKIEI